MEKCGKNICYIQEAKYALEIKGAQLILKTYGKCIL